MNSVYAQMAQDVGPGQGQADRHRPGHPREHARTAADPAIALGPDTASPLDMAEAYATLANHGEHGRTAWSMKITKDGQEVGLPDARTGRPSPRSAADTTTSILQCVVEGGTGTAAQAAERPAAGKTGTAEEDKAAWFAGYTPDLATVVAVMGQDSKTGVQKPLYGATGLDRVNGGGYPAEIWAQYTSGALDGKPPAEFDLRLEDGASTPTAPSPASSLRAPCRRWSPLPRPTPRRDTSVPTAPTDTPPTRARPSRRSPPRRRTSPPGGPTTGRARAGQVIRVAIRATQGGRWAAETADHEQRRVVTETVTTSVMSVPAVSLQVEPRGVLRALQPLGGHRVQVALPHQDVGDPADLDLGPVLRVVEHPVTGLHGPYALPDRDHLGPGQRLPTAAVAGMTMPRRPALALPECRCGPAHGRAASGWAACHGSCSHSRHDRTWPDGAMTPQGRCGPSSLSGPGRPSLSGAAWPAGARTPCGPGGPDEARAVRASPATASATGTIRSMRGWPPPYQLAPHARHHAVGGHIGPPGGPVHGRRRLRLRVPDDRLRVYPHPDLVERHGER